MASQNNGSFAISGLGAAFAHRQRDLFASLDAAEKERESTSNTRQPYLPVEDDEREENPLDVNPVRRRRPVTKQFRGKESIFKRPELPAPRRARNSIPDHQRNPHKYTKYTLGDVSPQDMSDRTNTAAALSFLQELRARKEETEHMDQDETAAPKAIVFKPVRSKAERRTSSMGSVSTVTTAQSSEEAERPSFRSSKLVMPEYVVGQKKQTLKKKVGLDSDSQSRDKAKKPKVKEIMLGHLIDEEDE